MKKTNKLLATASVLGVLSLANSAWGDNYILLNDAMIANKKPLDTFLEATIRNTTTNNNLTENDEVLAGNIDLNGKTLTFAGNNSANLYNIIGTGTLSLTNIIIENSTGVQVTLSGINSGIRFDLSNSKAQDVVSLDSGSLNDFYIDFFNINNDNIIIDVMAAFNALKISFQGENGNIAFDGNIKSASDFSVTGGVGITFAKNSTITAETGILFNTRGTITGGANVTEMVTKDNAALGSEGIQFLGGTSGSPLTYTFLNLNKLETDAPTGVIIDKYTTLASGDNCDITAPRLNLGVSSQIWLSTGKVAQTIMSNGSKITVTNNGNSAAVAAVEGTDGEEGTPATPAKYLQLGALSSSHGGTIHFTQDGLLFINRSAGAFNEATGRITVTGGADAESLAQFSNIVVTTATSEKGTLVVGKSDWTDGSIGKAINKGDTPLSISQLVASNSTFTSVDINAAKISVVGKSSFSNLTITGDFSESTEDPAVTFNNVTLNGKIDDANLAITISSSLNIASGDLKSFKSINGGGEISLSAGADQTFTIGDDETIGVSIIDTVDFASNPNSWIIVAGTGNVTGNITISQLLIGKNGGYVGAPVIEGVASTFSAPKITIKVLEVDLGNNNDDGYAFFGDVEFTDSAVVRQHKNNCSIYFDGTVTGRMIQDDDGTDTTRAALTIEKVDPAEAEDALTNGGSVYFKNDVTANITNKGLRREFYFSEVPHEEDDGVITYQDVTYQGDIDDTDVGGSNFRFTGNGTFAGGSIAGKPAVSGEHASPAVKASLIFAPTAAGKTLVIGKADKDGNITSSVTSTNMDFVQNTEGTVKLLGNFTVDGNYITDQSATIDISSAKPTLTVKGDFIPTTGVTIILSPTDTDDVAVEGKLMVSTGAKITLSTNTSSDEEEYSIYKNCPVTQTKTVKVLSFGGVQEKNSENAYDNVNLNTVLTLDANSWIGKTFSELSTKTSTTYTGTTYTATAAFAGSKDGTQTLQITYDVKSSEELFSDVKLASGFSDALAKFYSRWDNSEGKPNTMSFVKAVTSLKTSEEKGKVLANHFTPTQNVATTTAVSKIVSTTMDSALNTAAARITSIAAAGDEDSNLGAWVAPFMGRATQKSIGANPGYTMTSTGGTIGFDTKLDSNLLLGGALSMANSKMKLKDQSSGDKLDAKSLFASIYGSYYFNNNWLVEGIASVGRNTIKNKKAALEDKTASSNYKHTSFFGRVLGGYKYAVSDTFSVTPLAGVAYKYASSDTSNETGTVFENRKIKIGAVSKPSLVFGARTSYTVNAMEDGKLLLGMHAFANYDLNKKTPSMTVKTDGYDESIAAYSKSNSRMSYNVGADFTLKYDSIEYGVGYECNLAKKFVGQQGSLKLRLNF